METRNQKSGSREGAKSQIIKIIVGMKGSGKSALVKMEELKKYPREIIIDHREEYADCRAVEIKSLRELARYTHKKKIYRVRLGYSFTDDFESLCDYIYQTGNTTLILEELPRIIPRSNETLDGSIGDIIFRGRHQNINLIGICQRASMVNINLRSQADSFCSFRQMERTDVKTVCDLGNLDEEEVRTLPVGDYFEITFDGTIRKEVKQLKKLLTKA